MFVNPVRRLEAFLAAMTLGFGAWLMTPMVSMDSPAFAPVLAMAHETTWGALFLLNGLNHALALAINGKRWWSPIVRWVAGFSSASLYLVWAAGFAYEDSATTAVFTYSGLGIGSALTAVWAWRDAITSVRAQNGLHRT